MNTTRIRNLIAGGVLAAAAILAAPIAVGQPDNPGDCAAHPGGGACMVMPCMTMPCAPGAPVSPVDLRCVSQPMNGVCAGGPYALPGASGMPGMAGMPGAPGSGGGMGGMESMGGI